MWSIFQLLADDSMVTIFDAVGSAISRSTYQHLIDAGRARVTVVYAGDSRPEAHAHAAPANSSTPLASADLLALNSSNPIAGESAFRPTELAESGSWDLVVMEASFLELAMPNDAPSFFDQTLVVYCNVSFVETTPELSTFQVADKKLRSCGFQFHRFDEIDSRRFDNFPDDCARQMPVQQQFGGRMIYIKDWASLETLSPTQLQKYAVLAHEVLQSADLAHKALQEHDRLTGARLADRYLCRYRSAADARRAIAPSFRLPDEMPLIDFLRLEIEDGFSFSVPPNLMCISTYVLLEQERWFEIDVDFLCRCVKAGGTVLDVGANLGLYALPLARAVGPSGRVLAFEPSPLNREHLERSIAWNDTANIELSHCALSNFEGQSWLAQAWSGELDSLVMTPEASEAVTPVPVTTLNALAAAGTLGTVDILKLDAEGQEARIIAGGSAFFRDQSPIVMYEVTTGEKEHPEVRWLFETLGYQTFRLLGDGSMLVPVSNQDVMDRALINLFALKPDRARNLADRGLLALEGATDPLSESEREVAMQSYLALEFAAPFEIGPEDVEQCPFGDAIILYAAYQFLDNVDAARRHAFLSQAYRRISDFCRVSCHPSAQSTFARIAFDFGYRSLSADALKAIFVSGSVAIDQPFFPAAHRFDRLKTGDNLESWFHTAALEQFELSRSLSSRYLANLPRLESVCASEHASNQVLRRTILVAMNSGVPRARIQHYLDRLNSHQARNSAVWKGSIEGIYALWGA